MNVRASGYAALIVAAGLLLGVSAPLHATEDNVQPPGAQASDHAATVGSATDTSEPAKASRHHGGKKTAAKTRKSDRLTSKASKKATEDEAAKDTGSEDGNHDTGNAATTIPASFANANAQWPVDTKTSTAATAANLVSQPGGMLNQLGSQAEQPATASSDTANAQVVAADQLNDLDRAISNDKPPLTLARATIDAPTSSVTAQTNSPWDQTSLIGKIFIAFGGLLTMASAARMFMA